MHCGYKCMHKQGTASKLHRDVHNATLRATTVSCPQVLEIALLRAKGRDGGKNKFVGQRQKFSLSWKVFLQRNISDTSTGTTRSRSPVWVIEQRGVVICRNAPCLELSVRKRKRSFSLGGVCDPVFYLPNRGFPNE